MPVNFLPQYEILLRKAASDLAAASHLLNIEDAELDMEVVFFHLQQSAEKNLKALLAFHGIHFEKVHDLERLLDICTEHGIHLPEYASELVELNPYAVEGRYGLVADDMHDADRFCSILKEFKGFCLLSVQKK